MQQRLGMASGSLRTVVLAANHRPGSFVEIEVEIGQHHGALRRARDGRDEPGGCAMGAGRAGDDGWSAPRPLKRLDFALDQGRYSLAPVVEAALGEPLRPACEGDLEENEGNAPIGIVK